MKPIIIINLKTYKQGDAVLKLVKQISKVDKKIIIGVQASDISEAVGAVKNPIYVQHVDSQKIGRNTGYVLPEAVKADGAMGVFLNHSEHRLKMEVIKKTVKRCKTLNLKTAIFAKDLAQAKEIKKLKPNYLIIEPPELVAGKVSVSRAKPKLIEEIGKKLKYPFIVGAGIKTNEDLKIAMKLGAGGIAISSAITKARNPAKKLRELMR
ncbi:MAG: triose-phosphate isomerase [Nanoarchaeota archaeon]|nr:triose-phosphate isomerase [Nanoarchaeota archaeon]